MLKKLLVFTYLTLSITTVFGHAGHDHDAIPEAATLGVADITPRFYAISDNYEAVLVAPVEGKTTETMLYLMRTDSGAAVPKADVVLEVISPNNQKLTVSESDTPGVYRTDLKYEKNQPQIINVEVTDKDNFDILAFNNVKINDNHTTETVKHSTGGFELPGIPNYLLWALVASATIIMSANLYVLLAFLLKKSGADSENSIKSIFTALSIGGLLFGGVQPLRAHSGDDHSDLSVVESAVAGGAKRNHFVEVGTQFQADIRTTNVKEARIQDSFRALGQVRIRADRRAEVSSPVDGRIVNKGTAMPVEGTTVTKGQVLLVIEQIMSAADRVSLTNDKAQTQADLSAAQQELALAGREKHRAEQLVNVISKQEVERILADYKIAEDKVNAYKERLDTLVKSLADEDESVREVVIQAPVSGVITAANATTGESVITEKTLFEIVDLDEVFVEAEVFEGDINKVRHAKTARITVETYGDKTFTGTIQNIGQSVDPQKRTMKVLFNVNNPDHELRGGMFTNVDIESEEIKTRLLVPSESLYTENGVRKVFKKTAPETFLETPVMIDGYRDGMAIISGGLNANERVAVRGLYQIRMSPLAGGAK